MAAYQPLSRRPIAEAFRRTAHSMVRLCVRLGIHPDLVSYTSIVAAAEAGVCYWQAQAMPTLLLVAVVLCYVRLWLNMLDGMVALASEKASRSGEMVNALPDRISNVIIFVSVGHSGLCHPLSGDWVVIGTLLVAYVGTLGQAISIPCGFTTDNLPIGLQLGAAPFVEERLLGVAHAYEQATPWHTRRAPIAEG